MTEFPGKLKRKLEERKGNNALRVLSSAENLIDFSSNDYLGLAGDEFVFHKALQILEERGMNRNGATGSRLLTGNSELYHDVEQMLCNHHKADAALMFNSGYDANIGFFASIPQRGDLVFYDEFVHASVRDGIKLGNAKNYKFKHNNIDDLRLQIERIYSVAPEQGRGNSDRDAEVYVVTESVFSMDGDCPDLKELIGLCEEYAIRLIVDEAHAVGVFGNMGSGLLQAQGLEQRVFARIITFGKALGCHGAAILGSEKLKSYLVNYARSLIYTTGLPPHSLAAILASYLLLNNEQGLSKQQELKKNIAYFKAQIKELELESHWVESESAIQCCILNGNDRTKELSQNLIKNGLDVRPILAPTVPMGQERLRFCLHSFNAKEEIDKALRILKNNLDNSPFLVRKH